MDKGAEYYALFLSGRDEGIEKIVLEYRTGLQMFLYSLSGDMTLAEEMAQETFVKIFTVRPKYYAKASFRTWLYTVGRNLMRNAMRRKNRELSVAEPEEYFSDYADSPENLFLKTEQQRALHNALQSLRPEYKEILWLTYFESLSSKEIARILHKSAHNVDVIRARAKEMLKEQLRKDGFTDEIQ